MRDDAQFVFHIERIMLDPLGLVGRVEAALQVRVMRGNPGRACAPIIPAMTRSGA